MSSKRCLLTALALTLIAATAAFAGPQIIPAGIDLWHTPGNGTTYTDFADEPIPADFFCPGSAPFTGKIAFRGVPVSANKGLGSTDTIVERLDDAIFNSAREASTRIQVRALEFAGITTLETACGRFVASASLAGEQPITTMRIVQDHDRGGHYLAPIHVNLSIRFEPVKGSATASLGIYREVRFAANPDAQWINQPPKGGLHVPGFVSIDTNADRVADTFLPGTSSNFAAGWSLAPGRISQDQAAAAAVTPTFHCANPPICNKAHSTEPVLIEQ